MIHTSRPTRLLLLLALLCSPLPAQPPPPVKSSPDPQEQRMQDLLKQAETWRGLRAKQPVPSSTLGEKELAKTVAESFNEDMSAGTLRSMDVALKAFGLIPESLDLATFFPKLLTREIAGYYDPEKNAMSLVVRDGGVLGGREEEMGLDPQKAEDMVLVHELTHALQDQHFDLEKFVQTEPMSDEATARQALVEGDATLTMLNALMGVPFEELPGAADLLGSAMGASGTWMAGSSDELAEAPPFIRESLLFSYAQGNLFAISVRQAGGQKLLDYAFRKDPPRSSEQILHPEKWHGRRDDPVEVEWPDLSAALPGFVKAAEGEMGELPIRILLREALKDADRAEMASAGWGGDRFAVYQKKGEKNGRRLLVWITEWDSEKDAAEFVVAARGLGDGWQIEQPAKQRVVVLRGEVPAKQREPLRQRLAKAAARRPANRAIDLAALGIKDEDRAGSDPAKLAESLRDPAVRERIAELTGGAGLGESEGEGTGTIDGEGRSYTGPSFSLRLPEAAVAAGWQLMEAPSASVAVVARSSDSASWIGFGEQTVPEGGLDVETVLPLLEAGFRASVPGYKSLGGKTIESANGPAYEALFESGGEEPLRGILRIYTRGTTLVFATGMAGLEGWVEAEPVLRGILDAVALESGAPLAPGEPVK
jgi:hypothetical protein